MPVGSSSAQSVMLTVLTSHRGAGSCRLLSSYVTYHEYAPALADVTLNVVFEVLKVLADAAFETGTTYCCPETAAPDVSPQLLPV